jgi:hypothetical protein
VIPIAVAEAAVRSGHFSVWRHSPGERVGVGASTGHPNFFSAAHSAWHDREALIYAVDADGRDALVPRARWGDAFDRAAEIMGIDVRVGRRP